MKIKRGSPSAKITYLIFKIGDQGSEEEESEGWESEDASSWESEDGDEGSEGWGSEEEDSDE